MQNAVGVGEHTDILESVEKELNAIGKYAEQIEVLEKYFPAGDAVVNLNG